jgi:hypothetical protein
LASRAAGVPPRREFPARRHRPAGRTSSPSDSRSRPCSLFNLTARKCRWPIGSVGTPDFNFCGNSTADGVSYCAGHARMAYRFSGRAQATPVARPGRIALG